MRLMTDMEIVWFQNVQMGQRKRLQRGVHHYTHHDVVRIYVFVIKRRKTTIKSKLHLVICDAGISIKEKMNPFIDDLLISHLIFRHDTIFFFLFYRTLICQVIVTCY